MRLQAPPMTPTNKIVLITAVGFFLVNAILQLSTSFTLINYLGLSSNMVLKGHIYQFFTYPFIEVNFTSILFNCLLFWFIGGELELFWGKRFYQKFILYTLLVVGVTYFLVSLVNVNMQFVPLKGLTGINLALIVAYGLIYSERELLFMLIFPMKAKYFCMLLAAIEVYMAVFSAYSYSAWAHIVAMIFAFIYLKTLSRRAQSGDLKRKKRKMRSKLRLVKDDDNSQTWH